MYEILLRRKILEKLVTTQKGGKVDVFLKAKWCRENMSAHSFLLYLLSVYYMPGTVLGTQAKSETNKTDCPSGRLILGKW